MGRSCSFSADLWVLYCSTTLENGCLQLILSFVFAIVLDYYAHVLNHYPEEFLVLFLSCFPMLLSYTNSSASGMYVEIQVCSIQIFHCVCIFESFHSKTRKNKTNYSFWFYQPTLWMFPCTHWWLYGFIRYCLSEISFAQALINAVASVIRCIFLFCIILSTSLSFPQRRA